jgi:site-specific DNA-cytosine methylase
MNCIRCDKDLGHADSNNADYVIADEFIVPEKREQFYAVTIDKDKKESFTPIKQTTDSLLIPDVKRIEVKIQDVDIQKTGVVCPECYKSEDFIIWGFHKR